MGRVTDDGSTKNKPKGLNLNWRLNSIPAFVHDHPVVFKWLVGWSDRGEATAPVGKEKMTRLNEKRSYARYDGEGPITLVPAHSQSRQFEAGLLNFSAEGFSFFSRRPLKPGTTIIVRASVENYQHVSADVDCQLRSVGVATIKWCHENKTKNSCHH